MGLFSGRYDIVAAGDPIATWHESAWMTGGTLEWGGRRYLVCASLSSGTVSMGEGGRPPIATAHGIGRKNWTIEAEGTTYHFRRAAPWRQEERLRVDGRRVGSVRRTSIVRGNAAADLPGLPLAVEIFAVAVVLTMWRAPSAW